MSVEQVEHKRVALDSLISSPDNYNQHPPEQIHELKQSLRRFGQIKDSVTRKSANSYMLIAGHGITQAAHELLLEDPEQFAHLKEWNIVVVPPTWTDLDARAYMVSDNETAKKSEPDETLLAQLLQEQQDAGFDLAALGSDEETLRQMLESLGSELLEAHEEAPPEGFKEYGEGIETEYCCPKCGYSWSGKPK